MVIFAHKKFSIQILNMSIFEHIVLNIKNTGLRTVFNEASLGPLHNALRKRALTQHTQSERRLNKSIPQALRRRAMTQHTQSESHVLPPIWEQGLQAWFTLCAPGILHFVFLSKWQLDYQCVSGLLHAVWWSHLLINCCFGFSEEAHCQSFPSPSFKLASV